MKLKFVLFVLIVLCVFIKAEAQKKPVKAAPKKSTTATKVVSKKPIPKVVPKKKSTLVPIKSTERLVEIITDSGTMVARLYDSTPLHRDNFVKLVEQKFYDSLLFHRVIESFMIQGGDPTSKNATEDMRVGSGSAPGERIAAEFKPYLFHKKGALAAARDNNPAKASSNCQFYVVHGKKYAPAELESVFKDRVSPNNPSFQYTQEQKQIYTTIGGTPFLDQNYTVFGEVISGLDVIDKIAKVAKGPGDRPLKNIRMKIRLLN
jgi:peptidyl-prolyl cis-trans isomerase B (cyclophilin B)